MRGVPTCNVDCCRRRLDEVQLQNLQMRLEVEQLKACAASVAGSGATTEAILENMEVQR
jgi:hypothetical protein